MIFRGFIELMINSFHFTLKLYKKNFEINHFCFSDRTFSNNYISNKYLRILEQKFILLINKNYILLYYESNNDFTYFVKAK